MKHAHKIAYASLAAIIIGGSFLVWFYYIDGFYINKPVTFIDGVNPLNLQTDKDTYHPGELVSVYTAFCKNRDYNSVTQWAISDRFLTIYAPTPSKSIPNGCYPSDGGTEVYAIEPLPANMPSGCDYYLTGLTQRDIGGGRKIPQTLKTQTFCVEPSAVHSAT